MTTAPTEPRAYGIRVRLPDMKRAELLTPRGTLVNRRAHAAIIRDRAQAERIAAEIRAERPDAVVSVRPL